MTQVRVQPVRNGAGTALASRVSAYLVDQEGRRCIAFHASSKEGVAEYFSIPLTDTPLLLDLTPTDQIALDAAGTPSFYRFEIRVRHQAEAWGESLWDVQVPDSPAPVDLADLIGAASIPPGSLLLDRLLPDPSALPDDQWLKTSGGDWIVTVAPGGGSGDMQAAVYDPQSIAADAFARANHTGTQLLASISDAGALAALDAITAAQVDSEASPSGALLISDGASGVAWDAITEIQGTTGV